MKSGEFEPEFGLVMPFLNMQSKGGKYEDESFVAGYQMGMLSERLMRATEEVFSETLYSDCMGQADILAMRFRYSFEFVETEVEGWALATFKKIKES